MAQLAQLGNLKTAAASRLIVLVRVLGWDVDLTTIEHQIMDESGAR